jgi:hypothetical protein
MIELSLQIKYTRLLPRAEADVSKEILCYIQYITKNCHSHVSLKSLYYTSTLTEAV